MTDFSKVDDWHGCYRLSWKNLISDASMGHPAKFGRGLIQRIYEWLLEEGYLKPGDSVLDPFGGVALGAADALKNGVSHMAVELEQKFVDMGAGCDCTGISQADWIRFYGRLDRANYTDGRHWCPSCLEQAKATVEESPQLSLFSGGLSRSGAYVHNSGKIPFTLPHHYKGNISLFQRFARGGATARLVQGDSRELLRILKFQVGGVVSSPPYADIRMDGGGRFAKEGKGGMGLYTNEAHDTWFTQRDQQNLGNLRPGNFEAVVSSTPFAGNSGGRGEASRNGIDPALFDRHQGAMVGGIGAKENGNLGSMQPKEADFAAVVGSPPYVESLASDEPEKRGGLFRDPKRKNDKTLTATYGDSPGQVGAMRAGDFEGVIGSPPYEDSANQNSGTVDLEARKLRLEKSGIDSGYSANIGGPNGGFNRIQNYGESEGQLGGQAGDTFWAAARLILEQCYMALKPGGVAVWVTKDFVKAGQRVPFSDQWAALCEAVGFVPEARFRAWLVEDRGSQYDLQGELVTRTIEKKSFFRRLAEKNGSPRIDWEDVLVFRRGVK